LGENALKEETISIRNHSNTNSHNINSNNLYLKMKAYIEGTKFGAIPLSCPFVFDIVNPWREFR
jgi:hypothetical protein